MINTKPNLLALAGQVSSKSLKQSSAFLIGKRALATTYQSVEDLAVALAEAPDPALDGFEHHFRTVRNAVLRKLWSKGLLIGTSVIENLLFSALCDASVADPVAEVFRRIKDFGLHRPGFVLYPLHSFGITGAGLMGFLNHHHYNFIDSGAGVAISQQANSEEKLVAFLERATKSLRIKKRIPKDALQHYLQGGVLKWLLYNPLLLVKCKTFSTEYFENQFLLTIKLKLATTLITMLHGLQRPSVASRVYSTSSINNWETLDIKHYVVFQSAAHKARRFDARRIPMNMSRAELSEISELNLELNPLEWSRRPKAFGRIANAIKTVESGYMEHCVGSKVDTPVSRVYRKTFLALDYFRRSFRSAAKTEDGIVNLAIAFETLLTDAYAPKVGERIKRRVRLLTKGIAGSRKMIAGVESLSKLRNESVHTGKRSDEPDWQNCRLAFIHAFLGLVSRFNRLARLPKATGAPVGELIGDLS